MFYSPPLDAYIARQALTIGQKIERSNNSTPIPSHLALLPLALAQLHKLQIYPPLSLVQSLLALTGGHPTESSLEQLTRTEIAHLIALRWPAPARLGLVALLLYQIPFPDWEPPSEATPNVIYEALKNGLPGESIPAQAPPPPIVPLRDASQRIDEQLLSLLKILGAEAVAAEPALPIRLLSRIADIPLLNSLQQQLLGLKICFGEKPGRSSGNAPGAERGQVSGVENSSRTDWISLLPSQLAFPQEVLSYRYFRGELLFRTRELPDPPNLRPTVLLLDVSPPTFGPVEEITRVAAFAITRALYQARIPVVLLATGEERDRVITLDNPADWVEIWTQRSLAPPDEERVFKLAKAISANLGRASGLEPIILLLSQPWFGAEANLSPLPHLRGLFVEYPELEEEPVLANMCDRWESLNTKQFARLGKALGYVLG